MSEPHVNALYAKINPDKAVHNPEFNDVLGKSAAVFFARSTNAVEKMPNEIFDSLHSNLIGKIRKTGLYENVLTEERADEIIESGSALAHSKRIYLDSLTSVSVSNRDISNPLGKFLKTDNFLVFQVDHLPLFSEKSEQTERYVRMKLRLVDAESGFVIWSGIIEKLDLSVEEMKNIAAVSLALSDSLTDSFFHNFKRKWHKKRFGNLAKL